jgi:hypothetical protein
VKLITRLQLVPRSRIRGSIHQLALKSSLGSAGVTLTSVKTNVKRDILIYIRVKMCDDSVRHMPKMLPEFDVLKVV